MIRAWHYIFAFSLALLLHLLVVVSWAGSKKDEGAIADGQDGLQISVGLAGSFDEAPEVSAEHSEPEEKEPEEQKPLDTQAEAEPEEQVEPEEEQVPEPDEPIATEPVVKKIVNKDVKKVAKKEQPVVKKRVQKTQPKAQVKRSATDKNSDAKAQASKARNKATGVGERLETGGNKGAKQSYLVKVLAKIARNKRYPRSARRAGVVGTVTVKFVIVKNGRVKDAMIVTSSGDKRLDKEALAMLRRASPFPAIPKDAGGDSMSLTLPVEFSLNQTRKLF